MKASLILPSFNKSVALDFNLWSLLQFKINYDLEIIVIDDGSGQDGTTEVCNKYKNRLNIKYIFAGQRNKDKMIYRNPCFATNIGVKQSTGDIIILSAPDLFYLNNVIDLGINPLVENKKIMTTPEILYFDNTKNTLNYLLQHRTNILPENLIKEIQEDLECKYSVEMTYFIGIYKEEYMKIGGMDEDFIGFAGQDNDLMCRLQLNGLSYYKTPARMVHLYHSRSIFGSGTHYEVSEWIYNYNLLLERKGIIIRNKNKEWEKTNEN